MPRVSHGLEPLEAVGALEGFQRGVLRPDPSATPTDTFVLRLRTQCLRPLRDDLLRLSLCSCSRCPCVWDGRGTPLPRKKEARIQSRMNEAHGRHR